MLRRIALADAHFVGKKKTALAGGFLSKGGAA